MNRQPALNCPVDHTINRTINRTMSANRLLAATALSILFAACSSAPSLQGEPAPDHLEKGKQGKVLDAKRRDFHQVLVQLDQGIESYVAALANRGDQRADHQVDQLGKLLQDVVLDLKARHGFAAEDVDAIDALVGSTNVRNLMYGVPENEMQARFSMPYVVSAALLRGRLSLDDFTPEAVLRPELAALMPRVRMTGRDPKDEPADIKDRLPHLVAARLKNGQVLEAGKAWPRGSIQDPFTEDDRRFKFEDCVVRKLGPNAARDLEQELRGLDRVSDFGPLMAHLA